MIKERTHPHSSITWTMHARNGIKMKPKKREGIYTNKKQIQIKNSESFYKQNKIEAHLPLLSSHKTVDKAARCRKWWLYWRILNWVSTKTPFLAADYAKVMVLLYSSRLKAFNTHTEKERKKKKIETRLKASVVTGLLKT